MRGLAAFAVWTVLALPAGAATINVPGNQPTVQAAINAAVAGDVVVVAPGLYKENINFAGKAITVKSAAGPAVTILDGQQLGSVVTFATGEGRSSVLRGFTLRNGRVSSTSGGGIRIQGTSPTIINNIVTGNQGCSSGPGIHVQGGAPLISANTISSNSVQAGCTGQSGGGINVSGAGSAEITNNTITGNTASFGGGVAFNAAGTPTLSNNKISGNTATSSGGGISLSNASNVLIRQNLIVENTAPRGAGIDWLVPSGARGPRLVNNTIAANHASASPFVSGIYADGFDGQVELVNNIIYAKAGMIALSCGASIGASSVPVLRNNDVQNAFNSGSVSPYAGSCTDQTGVNGNAKVDPQFNSSVPYTLLSTSPLRDLGDPAETDVLLTDFSNGKRLFDGNQDGTVRIDIGADEFELVP
ncbi:MAG TPA: right-handed parallel beta-helix repeat-containing protein [Thermoanaerobaculia bacterium]|nr:right-handed parallel beta-helix repeat-containing protein [Thermoanaerobaculia bacterium]